MVASGSRALLGPATFLNLGFIFGHAVCLSPTLCRWCLCFPTGRVSNGPAVAYYWARFQRACRYVLNLAGFAGSAAKPNKPPPASHRASDHRPSPIVKQPTASQCGEHKSPSARPWLCLVAPPVWCGAAKQQGNAKPTGNCNDRRR